MPSPASALSTPRFVITVPTTFPPRSRPRSARSRAKVASRSSPSSTFPCSPTSTNRSASPSPPTPEAGPHLPHARRRPLGVQRTEALVDVAPVGIAAEGEDLGAELAQHRRSDAIGGAVRAVEHDAQSVEREVRGEGALQEDDVAPL